MTSVDAVDVLVARLRLHVDADGILLARAIAERLFAETWRAADYDLVPALRLLRCPTKVIHGERDFIPVDAAAAEADAIPGAELDVMHDCAHFPFLEQPDRFHQLVVEFLRRHRRSPHDGRHSAGSGGRRRSSRST